MRHRQDIDLAEGDSAACFQHAAPEFYGGKVHRQSGGAGDV